MARRREFRVYDWRRRRRRRRGLKDIAAIGASKGIGRVTGLGGPDLFRSGGGGGGQSEAVFAAFRSVLAKMSMAATVLDGEGGGIYYHWERECVIAFGIVWVRRGAEG